MNLICPKVDHKIEINLWRTQIMSGWSYNEVWRVKISKLIASWPNLACKLRLEYLKMPRLFLHRGVSSLNGIAQ